MESGELSRSGRLGFDSRQCNISLFSAASIPTLGPNQPPIQRVQGATSMRLKRQRYEAEHSSPSSAEDKTGGAIPTSSLHIS
jgi:hypothetical protein